MGTIDMVKIDLRGKTLKEVVTLIKKHKLGTGEISKGTDLWSPLSSKYKGVVIVWLNDEVAERWDKTKGNLPAKATYILWNGKKFQPQAGDDLHGFIKVDGNINWGEARTMNLMR